MKPFSAAAQGSSTREQKTGSQRVVSSEAWHASAVTCHRLLLNSNLSHLTNQPTLAQASDVGCCGVKSHEEQQVF
jgi:hypothetical protein